MVHVILVLLNRRRFESGVSFLHLGCCFGGCGNAAPWRSARLEQSIPLIHSCAPPGVGCFTSLEDIAMLTEGVPLWGPLVTLFSDSGDYPSENVCGVVHSRTTPQVVSVSLEFSGGR